jgi:hypothetical protein
VKFVAGDKTKQSIQDRGLSFEQILAAPFIDIIEHPTRSDQMILLVKIENYIVAAPCEQRDGNMRIITAFYSRKYTKEYLSHEDSTP